MRLWPGSPYPLGATWDGGGVNFAIFSEHATRVELCLFASADATTESARIALTECTDMVWHGYLPDVRPGQLYAYRVDGPWDPANGHRFDDSKVLLDPYAKAVGRQLHWSAAVFSTPLESNGEGPLDKQDDAADASLGMVLDPAFTWGDDRRPRIPWHETIIYELHVKGFSALDRAVPPPLRGTYLGLAATSSIQHLRDLGVTSVELMPVHAHVDEWALIQRGLKNYWGYNTIGFLAPDPRFAVTDAVGEFKMMVRALHAAGLEVILDVVYNHTAEGDHRGPTLSLRGVDNASYYRLQAENRAHYQDFTGCGNTLNMQSPHVLQLIMDSLRYWVEDMHVDGFRFDLAAALARELHACDRLSAFFDIIQQDPVISRVKLIAEPWDVGEGGYQVGNFPPGWTEWNGRYRDAIRRFWKSDPGVLPELATRLSGSSDLYSHSGRQPHASINFITAHDGYTLADLVAYEQKHNEANGEDNRDGDNNNLSWNCGVEGPTGEESVTALREQQRRNLLLTLMVSIGVPMISGGDEVGRTQQGNNNAYCLDSELTWTPKALPLEDAAFLEFARRVIELRKSQPVLRRRTFLAGRLSGAADVLWLRADGEEMTEADWNDGERRVLGVLLDGEEILEKDARGERITGDTLLILLNAGGEDVPWTLPAHNGNQWECVINTADPGAAPDLVERSAPWTLAAHSSAVFRLR